MCVSVCLSVWGNVHVLERAIVSDPHGDEVGD